MLLKSGRKALNRHILSILLNLCVVMLCASKGVEACPDCFLDIFAKWKIDSGKLKVLTPSPRTGRLGWGFFSSPSYPPPSRGR